MQIAFIRPLASRNWYINNVPLNYVHLAAYLREQGHQPHILDQVTGWRSEDIDKHIVANDIRVVGIGCMTCEFPDAVKESRRLKEVHPGITVILGGAHPSGAPEECLATGTVDYVVVGEGEIALTRLLDALQAGRQPENIPGLTMLPGRKGLKRAIAMSLKESTYLRRFSRSRVSRDVYWAR